MADGTENIGNVNVSVGADYSPLEAAFATAEDKAQQAGADIANALVSGAAGAGNLGTEIAGQLDQIPPAADQAGASLGGFADNASKAGESAKEADSKLAEMAERMAAVGEALIITEGLREFGAEALAAADSITHASIALTTITGSGEKAEETIKGLEELGMADGLAMPSLLSAATRMQQILGPATDVTEELRKVADGAAVMGTDIETAAQKFAQIASAGTASARTLTALGISLSGLATAFNEVDPEAEATASSVSKMFKAMDQTERIEVLNTALGKLGGTAQSVAEQTFGGQWQQLENQWHEVMVQAGQVLLPFISELTDLIKIDIVPFIRGAVDEFRSLPAPLQDTVVVLGLAAAAIVPLAGGMAAVGLAVNSLSGLLPALNGLIATIGVTASTTAVEETAAATATEALGVAAEGASVAASGLGAIVGGVLVAGVIAAVASFADLNAALKAAQSTLQGVSDADLTNFLTHITEVKQGTGEAGSATEQWEAKLKSLKDMLDLGAISAKQYEAAVKAIETAEDALAKKNLADSMNEIAGGLKLVVDRATKATDEYSILNAVIAENQKHFSAVAAAYQAGTATATQYQQAQDGVKTATDALTKAQTAASNAMMEEAIEQAKVDQAVMVYMENLENLPEVQRAELTALQQTTEALGPTLSGFMGLDGAIVDLQQKMPNFGVIMTTLSTGPLVGLRNALDEAKTKVAGLAGQMANGAQVGLKYEKALKQELDAQIALDQETAVLSLGLQGATDAYSLARDAVAAAQAKVDDLTTAFQSGLATYTQVQQAQRQLTSAQDALNNVVGQASPLLHAQTTEQQSLTPAVDTATASIGRQTTALIADAAALQSVAASVKSIEADMTAAFGGGGGGTASAPAGYQWRVTGIPGFGQTADLVPTADKVQADDTAMAKKLWDAGLTPTAIAKQMFISVDQVVKFLGIDLTAANETESQYNAAGGKTGALVYAPTQNLPTVTGAPIGESGSGGVTSSTVSSVSSSAVDGGSYPAVTAHQAVGEVWAVTGGTGIGGGGGGSSSIITTSITNAITGAAGGGDLSSVTQALGGAVQQLATNSGDLLPIAASMQATAQATQQLATAVAGLMIRLNSGGSSGTLPTVTGSAGTAYSVGQPSQTVAGGNPQGTYVPPPAAGNPIANIPGYNPFAPGPTSTGGGTTVTVNVDARGSIGLSPQQMTAQITTSVRDQLVGQLFTSGARLTR